MRKSRFSEEQKVKMLREAQSELSTAVDRVGYVDVALDGSG